MAGMEKLSNAILDKVNNDAREIIKEAESKAQERTDAAKKQQKARFEEEKNQLLNEANTEASRIQAQASIRIRQETLAVKTKIVDEIISEAKKTLATLPEGEKILANLVKESVDALAVDKVRVYVSSKDMAVMQKLVKENKELGKKVVEIKEQNFLGGIIVEDADGKNRIDNSFETRLEMLMPRLLPEIGEELFKA